MQIWKNMLYWHCLSILYHLSLYHQHMSSLYHLSVHHLYTYHLSYLSIIYLCLSLYITYLSSHHLFVFYLCTYLPYIYISINHQHVSVIVAWGRSIDLSIYLSTYRYRYIDIFNRILGDSEFSFLAVHVYILEVRSTGDFGDQLMWLSLTHRLSLWELILILAMTHEFRKPLLLSQEHVSHIYCCVRAYTCHFIKYMTKVALEPPVITMPWTRQSMHRW